MNNNWYSLDNAAKIYPAVYSHNDTNAYRLSVVLTEQVDPVLLKKAVIEALKRFPHLCVKLKKGLFWYYLEHNYHEPIIEKEDPRLFNSVRLYSKNGFMFTFSYYGKRINLEMFHALTDGSGSLEFLKSTLYYYFTLQGKKIKNDGSIQTEEIEMLSYEDIDDFNENYDKQVKEPEKEERAFQIKGRRYAENWTGLIKLFLKTDELKEKAHAYNTTITGFLGGVILYAIYLEYFKDKNQKYNLKLFMPVNARKYFNSQTLRNFVLFVRTTGEFRNRDITFNDCINYCNDTLNGVNKDLLIKRLVHNVNAEKHFFVKILFRFIKDLIMKIAYRLEGQHSTTLSFSNLGLVKLPDCFDNYIDHFEFVIGASYLSPVNIGAVSYNNIFVLAYATKFMDRKIIKRISRILSELNVDVTVEVNDVEGK